MSAFPASRSVWLLDAVLLLAAAQLPAHAQSHPRTGTIDGIVSDTNLVALADATVSILGSTIQVVTGPNGRFRIQRLPEGQYILVVRRLGYVPSSTALQVAGGDTLRMSFALQRIATALDTVVVSAQRYSLRMAGFEERRKLGFGQFMTQAQIEKRNVVAATDLLQTFISVKVGPGGIATNRRGGGKGSCRFQLYVDDVATPVRSVDDIASPKDLAGIEVYSGPATIPLQYKNSGAYCGVILLWTRVGS